MPSELNSKANQSDALQTESAVRWLLASLPLWALAGFLFPSIHAFSSSLIEMALPRGWVTSGLIVAYVPLTILLGCSFAAAQCLFLRAVRPWARRWVLATVAGGAAYVVINWTLGSLARNFPPPKNNWGWLFPNPFLWGSLLLGGFIAILQKWSMRGRVLVPSWFVPACALAGGAGGFGWVFLGLVLLSKALR